MDTLEQQLNKAFLWLERMNGVTPELINNNLTKAQTKILALAGKTTNARELNIAINKIMTEAFAPIEGSMLFDKEVIGELAWNSTGVIMSGWVAKSAADKFKKFDDVTKATKAKILNPKTLYQGHTLDNHLKHLRTTTVRKIQGQLAVAVEGGQGIQQITRDLRNTFGALERNELNALTRTVLLESIRDSQDANFDVFADEIEEYYYNATLDTRTTPRCWELNGTTSKKKEDITKLLNFHWNCRSILGVRTDLSKEFEAQQNVVQFDGKTVNHRDGTKSTKFSVDKVKKVSPNASPDTAFRALDKEFQIAYMGRTRYELWQSGKASFTEMTRATRNTFLPVSVIKKNLNLD